MKDFLKCLLISFTLIFLLGGFFVGDVEGYNDIRGWIKNTYKPSPPRTYHWGGISEANESKNDKPYVDPSSSSSAPKKTTGPIDPCYNFSCSGVGESKTIVGNGCICTRSSFASAAGALHSLPVDVRDSGGSSICIYK